MPTVTKTYYHNIDLDNNQLINVVIENRATAPVNPVDGQIYYNTVDKKVYTYNGAQSTWGTVASQYVETDPIFTASPAFGITSTNITNWNTAYGWGNHAGLYPLLSGSYANPSWITSLAWSKISGAPAFLTAETDPIYVASSWYTTTNNSANWNTAFGWGNHASAGYQLASQKGQVNGYASLDGSGLVPAGQLPSYVDDVLEYNNLASFPLTGFAGKIYVALDTNETYRWSGSAYIRIASGAVQSVNGNIGIVTITLASLGGISLTSLSSTALGLTYTNTTGVFSFASGYAIPTITSQNNWDIAFTDRLKWDGGSTGLVAATGRASLGLIIGTDILAYRTFGTAANNNTGDFEVPLTFSTGLLRVGNTVSNTITQYTDSLARLSISSSATGLTYTNTTGVFTLTSGYVIPTTTSASNWDTAYTNRITSLTTTGSSGASTLVGNTLNIPTYTLAGLGGVPTSRTLTINGTAYDLSADRSWTIPVHDAVTIGTANGLSLAGQVLSLALSSSSTNGALSSTDWSTFNGKQNAITLTTTGSSGSSTLVGATLNVPTYTLAGLGGQPQLNGTGFVKISGTTISYDNSTYYLASNPSAYIALTALTASAPLSYNNTTGAFAISQASGSTNGYLSSTDWTTFNNKQSAITLTTTGTSGAATLVGSTLNIPQYQSVLTNPVTGTGTTNYIPKWTSGSGLGNSLVYDDGTNIGIGTATPSHLLHIQSSQTGTTQISNVLQTWRTNASGRDITLQFSDGTNQAYISSLSGNLCFATNGANERLRITSGGNLLLNSTTDNGNRLQVTGNVYLGGDVGIGNSSPSGALHVSTFGKYSYFSSNADGAYPANIQGISFGWNLSGGSGETIIAYNKGGGSTGGLVFANNDGGSYNARMTLTSSGNLGIAVVPSAWSTLWSVQQFGQAGSLFAYKSGSNYTVISNNSYAVGGSFQVGDARYINNGFSTAYAQNNSGEHLWLTAPSGTAGGTITHTQAMTLTASGRLLLGTTTEGTHTIDVAGNGRFSSSSSTNLIVERTGSNGVFLGLKDASGSFAYIGANNGDFIVQTPTGSYSTKLTIANSGAATFSNALQVAGQQAAANYGGTGLNFDFTTGNIGRIASVKTTSGGSQLQFFVYNTSGADVNALQITSGGNVGIGTTSPQRILTVYNSSAATLYQTPTSGTGANDGFYVGQTGDVSYVWNYNNFPLAFGTNNTERMRITSGGNLLVGTTTDTGERLQVNGAATFSSSVGIGVSPSCSLHIEKASDNNILAVIGQSGYEGALFLSGAGSGKDANIVVGNGKDLQFHTTPSATPVVDGTARMVLAATGNLLVGSIVDTGERLQVSGSVLATSFIKSGGTSSQYLMADGSTSTLTNPVTGTGTTTRLPIWTSSTALGNSGILDNGTSVTLDSRALIGTSATFTGNMNADDYNMAAWKILDWNGVVAQIGGISASQWTQLEFFTSGTSKMTLTSGGNLGLGVTPSAWYAYKGFQIGNQGSIGATGTVINFSQNIYYGASGNSYIENGKAAMYQLNDGVHVWRIAGTGTAGNAITFTEAMTLTSGGNLLVGGSVDSGEKLQVSGGVKVSDATPILTINGTTTSIPFGVEFRASGLDGYIKHTPLTGLLNIASGRSVGWGGFITFTTDTVERMRIKSDGIINLSNVPSSATGLSAGDIYKDASGFLKIV